jgi:hypothetical protein
MEMEARSSLAVRFFLVMKSTEEVRDLTLRVHEMKT